MKALKLKAIFFPNDDVLVKPPDFLSTSDKTGEEKSKNCTISSIDQLKTILRGRQLKKQDIQKLKTSELDQDMVKKLSEWKKFESPSSSIKRKFTFKRTITMQNNSVAQTPSPSRSVSVYQTVIPSRGNKPVDALLTTVQGIVAVERFKKKHLDAEIQRISEFNKITENSIKTKIQKSLKEIEGLKKFIRETSEKLENLKKKMELLNKNYEETLNGISSQEAQELMLGDRNKKKILKPGEESQYFIKKEKFRQLKQELHSKYQEDKENCARDIEKIKGYLGMSESQRLQSKKELKQYREEIVMLYCRILKDGKDIRADGLRWIIKSLWKMGEFIPISAFPKFFDDEASHFLLTMSEKDLEIEKYIKKLDELRKEIKNKRTSAEITTAKDLYKTVRIRLRTISQSAVGQLFDGTKLIEDPNQTINNFTNKDAPSQYGEITFIREKISQLNEYVKEITSQEIKRVTESYKSNPGEAESLGLFHLIKCLVGEKVREFNNYTRSKKKQKNKISLFSQ